MMLWLQVGSTPLSKAAFEGNMAAVVALLEGKANTDARNQVNITTTNSLAFAACLLSFPNLGALDVKGSISHDCHRKD